jgi:hypothetical protein
MTLEGITPDHPGRVFEAWRSRLRRGDVTKLLSTANEPRAFKNALFDLSSQDERFFIIAAASFVRCVFLTRPGQILLFVDKVGQDTNHAGVRLEGGGQAVPRVLYSVLKSSTFEGDRRIETTQTVDFSKLKAERIFVRNLVAIGDLIVGSGQTLVVDQRTCILLGDVMLHPGAKLEGSGVDSGVNWRMLRQQHLDRRDFESELQFKDDWDRPPVVVVPSGLDFREGYPNEINIYDAVVGGDIHLRTGQSLTVGVTRQVGRRTSVLIRGSVICDGGTPQIIGDRGFHALGRSMPSLGPVTIGARADRVG